MGDLVHDLAAAQELLRAVFGGAIDQIRSVCPPGESKPMAPEDARSLRRSRVIRQSAKRFAPIGDEVPRSGAEANSDARVGVEAFPLVTLLTRIVGRGRVTLVTHPYQQ